MRIRKGRPRYPRSDKEQDVFNILTFYGKAWLTKSGPGVRQNFIDGWRALNENGRATARRKGWDRPQWTGAARDATRKLKRRTKREKTHV
jgi:hypothetical protein